MPPWLLKMFASWAIKAIKHKIDLKRIDKYVNKPNELDKQMKQVQKNSNKALKYIEELEKEIGILKAESHPPIFTKKQLKDILNRLKKLEKNG